MITILHGDCRDILPTLPADSFDCCVTSPPYWGLRSYLPDGHNDKHREIGLEPTMQGYLDTMVGVMREVRRVLKPTATCFLNIGDSYASGGGVAQPHRDSSGGIGKKGTRGTQPYHSAGGGFSKFSSLGSGIKAKDLCMIPNRLAILLQEDGWWVRSEIIWAKKNCMPESVRDRPTSAHEKVWLLTKAEKYFYDSDAIREEISESTLQRFGRFAKITGKNGTSTIDRSLPTGSASTCGVNADIGRNARNVWSIASQPYSGAHFATMPPELAERCIKAGCPVGGAVLDPFGGAGTTGLVADRLGRDATLIELNPEYCGLAADRVRDDAGLFAQLSDAAE